MCLYVYLYMCVYICIYIYKVCRCVWWGNWGYLNFGNLQECSFLNRYTSFLPPETIKRLVKPLSLDLDH